MKKYLYFLLVMVMLIATACGATAADPVGGVGDGGDGSELGGAAKSAGRSGGFTCSSVATNKTLATMRSELLTALNNHRAANGSPAVTMNTKLNQAAQGHSVDMATNMFMDHTGSDGLYIDARIDNTGYIKNYWAENIVGGYTMTSGSAATGWWIGPESTQTHKDNMVDTNFTQVGIGYAYNANDNVLYYCHYWTLVFASPQ